MENDDGQPLSHYRDVHPGCRVLFCCPCGKSKSVELATVIRQVGQHVGIRAVAKSARIPCECGQLRWETRPDFPGGERSHGP